MAEVTRQARRASGLRSRPASASGSGVGVEVGVAVGVGLGGPPRSASRRACHRDVAARPRGACRCRRSAAARRAGAHAYVQRRPGQVDLEPRTVARPPGDEQASGRDRPRRGRGPESGHATRTSPRGEAPDPPEWTGTTLVAMRAAIAMMPLKPPAMRIGDDLAAGDPTEPAGADTGSGSGARATRTRPTGRDATGRRAPPGPAPPPIPPLRSGVSPLTPCVLAACPLQPAESSSGGSTPP